MRAVLPAVVAGGTFAGCAIVGLAAGALAGARLEMPLGAPLGLAIGAALGAYGAFRLLAKSMA
jgi:hypothetical protein